MEESLKEWSTTHQGEEAPKNSEFNSVKVPEIPSRTDIEEFIVEKRKQVRLLSITFLIYSVLNAKIFARR